MSKTQTAQTPGKAEMRFGLMRAREPFIGAALLAGVCALVFFVFLGTVPFHDKGEPREALVVRDIVLNGEWLFPLKEGQQIPSKPPLFHWSAALASIISGRLTEASVRLPSALFASCGVFLLYLLGQKLYGTGTGLLAGVLLATTVGYQNAAVEARVDMTLTFFLTLSLTLFYALYRSFLRHEFWWYLFFFLSGLGVLAKGPVSAVLCALVVLSFLALEKRWNLIRRICLHPGLILGIAVFSFWYAFALWKGGEQFFGLQFVKENFARFFVHGEGGTGHQKPLYYFVPYLFSLGLPWTLFLPFMIVDVVRYQRFRDDSTLFLVTWAISVFLFFSLSAGKRPVYILPLYPPLALLLASWLQHDGARVEGRPAIKAIGYVAAVLGVLSVVSLFGLWVSGDLFWVLRYVHLKPSAIKQLGSISGSAREFGWFLYFFLLASGILWLLAARSFTRWKVLSGVTVVACFSVLTSMFVQGIVNPVLAEGRSYKSFVETVERRYRSDGSLYLFPIGLDYNSLLFYAGNDLEVLSEPDRLLGNLEHSHAYAIMSEEEWVAVAERSPVPLAVELRSRGGGPDGDHRLVLVRADR